MTEGYVVESKLLDDICYAFADIEKPNLSLLKSQLSSNDNEYYNALDFLSKFDRDELQISHLLRYEEDFTVLLFFLPTSVLYYYFPAFLRISITDYQNSENFFDSILVLLSGSYIQESEGFCASFRKLMTEKQKLIVIEYIQYMNKMHSDDFWFESADSITNAVLKNK